MPANNQKRNSDFQIPECYASEKMAVFSGSPLLSVGACFPCARLFGTVLGALHASHRNLLRQVFFFFFKPPFRDEEIEAQRFKTLRVLRKKCQDHNLNPYCLAPVSDSSVLSYSIFWCFWDCSAFNLMILNLSLHPSSPLTSVISIPAASWVALPESLAGTCNST